MGDGNGLVKIQETDVYCISLPESRPLCVSGVSAVWDRACTGFASATNTWALIFRAMIIACRNVTALLCLDFECICQ